MRITGTMMRIKGIKRYRSKGRWYCYHRASGTKLKAGFGTPAFIAELATIEEEWKRKGGAEAVPGSLGQAIVLYKKALAFTELATRTRSDYQKIFDYLQPLERMPLVKIDSAFVAKLRDRTYDQRRRRFANYVVSVLGSIFAHAKEYGLVNLNPAQGVKSIKRPRDLPKANRPWTTGEREVVLETAPAHLKVGIALGMFTGMREGDVIRLPRNARGDDGWIFWKSGKAGTDVEWPAHSRLTEILEQTAPDAVTMCINSKGRPWRSENSFRSAFFKHIQKLEAEGRVGAGLTFHGLRHSVATLLKEDGVSDEDIAIALGQKSVRMARHYSERASKRQRMKTVVTKFDPLKGSGG